MALAKARLQLFLSAVTLQFAISGYVRSSAGQLNCLTWVAASDEVRRGNLFYEEGVSVVPEYSSQQHFPVEIEGGGAEALSDSNTRRLIVGRLRGGFDFSTAGTAAGGIAQNQYQFNPCFQDTPSGGRSITTEIPSNDSEHDVNLILYPLQRTSFQFHLPANLHDQRVCICFPPREQC